MTEAQFIRKYSRVWKDFEDLQTIIGKKGLSKLNFTTLSKLERSYTRISGHLSYAATNYPASGVQEYLNGLVSTAHHQLIPAKKGNPRQFLHFYDRKLPQLLRKNSAFLWVAFSIFLVGYLFSFLYAWIQPETATAFLPPQYLQGGNIGAQAPTNWDHPLMSSIILSNNIFVALQVFAYGISAGLGTVYVLLQNGLVLGALSAVVIHQGHALLYWSLILPHGIIELSAIFISGAAGLKIGYGLLFPGFYKRKDALVLQGKEALQLIGAVIPMLIIAAIIEGFLTPSALSPTIKLSFAFFTGILLLCYYRSGRRSDHP